MLVERRSRQGGRAGRRPDALVVEEPLSIRLDDTLVATTMRTPGDDFELAAGFCHTERLLGGARIESIRYCDTGSAVETEFNVVSVDTGGAAPAPVPRLASTGSACGICGNEAIDELTADLGRLSATTVIAPEALLDVPEKVAPVQELFERTGAVHSAAAFRQDGSPEVVREDIGRHNAVDKVIGRLLLDERLPAGSLGLYVSGRASFEIVQKAWAAGFATVLSISAPSALAVESASAAGIALAGFVRDDSLNLYTDGFDGSRDAQS